MKNILDKIADEFYIKIGLIFLTLIGYIPTSLGLYANHMKKAFLLLGFGIILYHFIRNRFVLTHKSKWLCVFFLLFYAVTILVNYISGRYIESMGSWKHNNISQFLYTVLFILLFTYADPKKDTNRIKSEMKYLSLVVITITACFSLFSLYTFLNNIYYEIPDILTEVEETYVVIGIKYGRLYGFLYPNTGALFDLFSIALSFYLIKYDEKAQKNPYKWFLAMNIILQYICIILTQSRTVLVLLSGFIFLAGVTVLREQNKKLLICLGVSGMLACVPMVIQNSALNALRVLPNAVGEIKENLDINTEEDAEDEESLIVERDDTDWDDDRGVFNGRADLWKAGMKAVGNNLAFGVTGEGVYEAVVPYITSERLKSPLRSTGLHNGYFMTLLCNGVFGFCFLYLFIFFEMFRSIKKFITIKSKERYVLGFLIILSIVRMVHELVESCIMYASNFPRVFFWVMFGYMIIYRDVLKEEYAYTKEIDASEVKPLLNDILKNIKDIAKNNDIDFYLDSGTLLGAVRHSGFIPWDDDIDIIVKREDYQKLIDAINRESSRYKVLTIYNNESYYYPFAKVVDTNTVMFEKGEPENKDLGLYVDIFPVDNIPDDQAERDAMFAELIKLRRRFWYCRMDDDQMKKYPIQRQLKIAIVKNIYGLKYLGKKIDKLSRKYQKTDTKYAVDIVWAIPDDMHKLLIPKEWYGTPKELAFEGVNYPVPNEYDKYLTVCYGNYMELPPEEARVSNHSFKAFWKTEG